MKNDNTVRFTPKNYVVTAVLLAIVTAALAAAPYWLGRADLRLAGEIMLYISLATLWNLLAGYAGLVSVGQQAYVGLGGYMLFAFTIFIGVPPILAIPIAGVIGALLAIPVAFLVFRLRGAYFAIGTWVIAEVFRLSFAQISALGGGSGTSIPASIVKSMAETRAARESLSYWLAFGLAAFIILFVYLYLRSSKGLALTAIRDNELAASSLGIDIWKTKFFTYVVSAALTSMVGALIFLQKLRISPDAAFSVNDWTAFVIFIVVIGGIGTIEGPIIGAIIFFALRETLADLGTGYLITLGVVAIIIMLKAPNGIWGILRDRFDISFFPLLYRVENQKQDR
ncbi:branched-chain amino acid ABC transporter permease [Maritalea myrionectae]|uniref:branched-chain amino acid ABC transporter permease n=1 Tax=Maritalea myrionectae TaxID=454601 RepID=UPI00042417D1|nr:branched-chain amino acid ABC transporter permease [Maritalea myrionectae]